MEPLFIGAYWGPRPESADSCAARLAACLAGLGDLTPILHDWQSKTDGISDSRPVRASIDHASLANMLTSGMNRRGETGEAIPELGYDIGLWNGDSEVAVGFGMSCGSFHRRLVNSFVLDLPKPLGRGADLYRIELAKAMMRVAVRAWEPEWAVLSTRGLRDAQPERRGGPFIGWITYLSDPGGLVRELPLSAATEAVSETGGLLIVLGDAPHRVTVDEAREVAEPLWKQLPP